MGQRRVPRCSTAAAAPGRPAWLHAAGEPVRSVAGCGHVSDVGFRSHGVRICQLSPCCLPPLQDAAEGRAAPAAAAAVATATNRPSFTPSTALVRVALCSFDTVALNTGGVVWVCCVGGPACPVAPPPKRPACIPDGKSIADLALMPPSPPPFLSLQRCSRCGRLACLSSWMGTASTGWCTSPRWGLLPFLLSFSLVPFTFYSNSQLIASTCWVLLGVGQPL